MGDYTVIYADPPWWYNQRCDTDSMRGGACRQYGLMRDADLLAMRPRLDGWAADDCALCLWTTGPRQDFAVDLGRAWGFRYGTMLAVWVKTYDGNKPVTTCGHYTSQTCEYMHLWLRGSMPVAERMLPQVGWYARGEHSAKPTEFRRLIECLWPDARRLELFSRNACPGWDAWGNQVGLLTGDRKQVKRWRLGDQATLFGDEEGRGC
jgi:N6-adenosine-specific RNA methylase IME4